MISLPWNLPLLCYISCRMMHLYPSPLIPQAWEKALASIPDKAFTKFIIRGIAQGFRIGVHEGHAFKPSRQNLKSAYDHPEVVTVYLQSEERLDKLAWLPPALTVTPPVVQISPFGVIPKKYKPKKWRLIVDLSSPKGHSINDAIPRELCSVSYTSIDHAVSMARGLGTGSLLAKWT